MWITRETQLRFCKILAARASGSLGFPDPKRVIILHAAATFPGFEPVLWEKSVCEKTENRARSL